MSKKPAFPPFEKGKKQRKATQNRGYMEDAKSQYVGAVSSNNIPTGYHPPTRTNSTKILFANKDGRTPVSSDLPYSSTPSSGRDNNGVQQGTRDNGSYSSVLKHGL